jgi:hypothetical protein
LRHRYDWRCQRFSRFPNANTNSNGHSYCHGNRNANWDTNCYSNCNVDAKWDANCHCNVDRYTSPRNSTYANTAASPDTSTSPDTSASPVGPCISSDWCFADG